MAYNRCVEKMKIGIIGSGVVGEATGKAFGHFNNEVTFCDINHDILKRLHQEGLSVADNTSLLVKESEVVFICVNTPTISDGLQDLRALQSVLDDVVVGLNELDSHTTIIVKSTILPETSERIVQHLKQTTQHQNWNYFYNPEFLTANNALSDTLYPDRVVIGGILKNNWSVIDKLFDWWRCPIVKTGYTEAEMIKYVSNCFLSTKISFFNEMGEISKTLKLDIKIIEEAVSLDKRIGKYGTASGHFFGGACLPKDTLSFQTKFKSKILDKVLEVNKE